MRKTELIPKKIHYCWFGGAPLPESVQRCIASWRLYCPKYEIIEWNESNFNISVNDFVLKAYQNKKWAFVTDYARLHVVYNEGGIYLDTDVELIRSLDDLLKYKAYMGFEGSEYIATGLGFGAIKGFPLLKEMLSIYDSLDFDRVKNKVEQISTPVLITNLLEKHGLVRNGERQAVRELELFPEDYFCPKSPITRLLNITNNTYSIHHYDASWVDAQEKAHIKKLEDKAKILMETQSKRVSIIIPVYNGQDYLRDAVDSALNQTYRNIEVIVINDGSTDNTDLIARSYGNRIRYIKKENGGVASALNLGITKMRGDYFAWLSHDDKYHHEKIERQMAFATQFTDQKVVTVTNWSIIDAEGNHIKDNYIDHKLEANAKSFLAFDRKTWLNGCAMLIPKEFFSEVGLFDETLKSTQDYDMWFRFAEKGVCFKILPDHLFYSRAHTKQGSIAMPDALINSDKIHSYIIQRLTHDDIAEYFDYSSDKYMDVYNNFLYSGYKLASAYILKDLLLHLKSCGKEQDIYQTIKKELLGSFSFEYFTMQNIIGLYNRPKSKKRILFFTAHWYTGGVERFMVNLINGLTDIYDVVVVSVDTKLEGTIKIPGNVCHIRVSDNYFKNSYNYILYAICLIFQVDIAMGCMNLFEKVLDFYDLADGSEFKTIASNHEFYFYPYEYHHLYPLIERRLEAYKKIDAAVWLTNYNTFVYSNFNTNGVLIPNPNTYEIQADTVKDPNSKIILCVGRFNDYVKRIDRILQCYKKVLYKIPEAKLILVGKCNPDLPFSPDIPKSINQLIANLCIPSERIYFEGETEDMAPYYSIADVLLLASNSEGFPMVINEAACFGVPVVCNYIPGLEDIITDNKNGYLVPQDDLDLLADKVCSILNDNENKIRLSKNAKEMASRFSKDTVIKKWRELFEIILNEEGMIKEARLKERFGYDTSNLAQYAQNLCMEINKVVQIASGEKYRHIEQQSRQPSEQISNYRSRLSLYYHKVITCYKQYGLRITLSKISQKIVDKIGLRIKN